MSRTRPVRRRAGCPATRAAAAAATLAALHSAAQAQDAPPAAAQLQTITVTAERRLENIRDVPNSVSALQGEALDVLTSSGQDVRLLSGRVPSLNIESSFGRAFPRFYIRGYGNTDFRLNASQPVSLVYDDVVQENPILKGFPIFDIEQIEVLRGPQGSLFGRNTPAGVVKFDSVRPTPRMEGYGSLSFGTYNSINTEGAVNVPVGSGMGLRVSVLDETRDNWVHNTYAPGPTRDLEGYRDSAMRTQFLYAPTKDLSVLFNVHARDFKGSSRLFRGNIIQPGSNDFVPGFDPAKIAYDGQNTSTQQNYGSNLRLRFGLGPVALYSITGYETVRTYNRGDIDGTVAGVGAGFPDETADGMPKHSQFTQEFRVESTVAGPLSWQAGLFIFSEDYKVESFDYNSTQGGAQDGYERVRQKNDAYAVFGAVDYALTEQIKVRGGLRYTTDKKDFTVEDYNFGGVAGLAALAAAKGAISAAPTDHKVSWDLSGTYALDKNTNLYARAATGFRGSSVQGAAFFNAQSVAGPETNTSFEAGVKTELFDRRARLSFDVFSYTVKDLQLTAVGGGQNGNTLINVAKATGQGFELDLQAYLTERWLATLGVGYNKTQLRQAGLGVDACGDGCTLQNTVLAPVDPAHGKFAPTVLIDGNPLPQAPKVTASFTLKYTQPVGAGEFYAYTDWVYRSEVNFFLYKAAEFTGKALTEGGLRLGYSWGNGKYDVAAFGRNITNQIRIVGGIDFDNLTGFINDPRTWGVQFKANF